ncbi:acyl-CoA dehydrogenase family protein [Salinicoccus roseus]|uniref:Acyl-CoA dehydrogenase n=1 Tax=Salinicoccus roseus TaxID=45670 RepID=A0A0C2HEY6_9STAP|nr:acyl-CoA dehydrogenase family protein [Salinicoccus roseus]KIH70184.1 acyl-CoA dehydrogenase [Salinicoccus roseus]MDB0581033.1 acyl-CoA/acyl-ACP dehydrogenase [Salinicoccus roseus]
MAVEELNREHVVDKIIKEQLKPLVKKVDQQAYYPEEYLRALAENGLFDSDGYKVEEVRRREALLVEWTAGTCMTTAFNLWCHLASLTYLRHCDNQYLKSEILPPLEKGEFFGGTGLSNPMKYYSGLEPLHLKAERREGGYVVSGSLASVSNLKSGHWFGIIASLDGGGEIMAFVPCTVEGLKMKERADYIGVNGSATYGCRFNDVFIPEEWIISTDAQSFVDVIRPTFILYQTPLGLGVTSSAIRSMKKAPKKQGNINAYLPVQADEVEAGYIDLKNEFETLIRDGYDGSRLRGLMQLRLDIDRLTLKAVHGDMLHYGGAGYLQNSHQSRRLREVYFLLNLTPTVKHLEKELST